MWNILYNLISFDLVRRISHWEKNNHVHAAYITDGARAHPTTSLDACTYLRVFAFASAPCNIRIPLSYLKDQYRSVSCHDGGDLTTTSHITNNPVNVSLTPFPYRQI